MSIGSEESFNLTRILQRWKWPRKAKPAFDDSEYTNLLRYTLQLAAEREIAAGVLAELSELLERNAPSWYADEQQERVESALELLQRL
jgi:acyl-ACP thioesterase